MEHIRSNISTGAVWEPSDCYSRALRLGNHIAISGPTPIGLDGESVAWAIRFEQQDLHVGVVDNPGHGILVCQVAFNAQHPLQFLHGLPTD